MNNSWALLVAAFAACGAGVAAFGWWRQRQHAGRLQALLQDADISRRALADELLALRRTPAAATPADATAAPVAPAPAVVPASDSLERRQALAMALAPSLAMAPDLTWQDTQPAVEVVEGAAFAPTMPAPLD